MAEQKSGAVAEKKLIGLIGLTKLQSAASYNFLQKLKNTTNNLNFMNHWLVKEEPKKYSFDNLIEDGKTVWDGVRSFQARNNLRGMRKGDKVLFYHSTTDKSVVGLATVSRGQFPDPTDEKWVAVELKPVKKFVRAVTLDAIKIEKSLENIALIKQTRLSVMPLTEKEFEIIVNLGR